MGRADQGGRRKRGMTDVRAIWFLSHRRLAVSFWAFSAPVPMSKLGAHATRYGRPGMAPTF
jgi:hypothetical protein